MQPDQVRQLRRRKLQLYISLLPAGALPTFDDDLCDNAAFSAVMQEIAQVAPAGFGLTVGRHRSLFELGILGHVTMSCATLGEVFNLWQIFGKSAGELVLFDAATASDEAGSKWSIQIKPFPYLPQSVARLLADELCATFFVFAREITGLDFRDFSVELSHTAVAECDYASAFPGPVTFGAPITRVVGPATALDLAVLPRHGEAASLMIDQRDSNHHDLQSLKPTTMQLHDFLLRRRGAPVTLNAAADAMRFSQRTLVRRLAAEQTTFGAELDLFRQRYAMALAQHGGLKAKQIAHLLGYKSENSLRKAFRKWAGMPIGAWSASLRAADHREHLDRWRQSSDTETSMLAHDITAAPENPEG